MKPNAVRSIACRAFVVSSVLSAAVVVVRAEEATMSIPEQVRRTGAFERIVVSNDLELQLADLTGNAELIVEASTTGARWFLSADGADIYTDYTLSVRSIIKNTRRPELHAGDSIIVRRESGTVVVDGRAAVSYENGFPPFGASERYILFLKWRPGGDVYSVFGGAWGAFAAGDRITPVHVAFDQSQPPAPSLSRAEFLGELRALLKF